MKHYGDITLLDGANLPPVDCVTGGSPCQDLSIAGSRAGLKGERSGLFLEQIRIVKEMREATNGAYPRYMVWENVPGAFTSNKGRDFQRVLTEIVQICQADAPPVPLPDKGKWPKSGYLYDELGGWSVAWRQHDAQFWGVPQRRKRIAIVADFRGFTAAHVLFECESVSGDTETGREAGEETAATTGGDIDPTIILNDQGGSMIDVGVDIMPTLRAATHGHVPLVYDARGNGNGQTIPTITGDHQNRVTDYTAVCVGNGQLHQMSMKPIANTLSTVHDQQAVMVGNAVRRLTPLECERAQGFPDGWTDIGEWTDTNGKKRKCSDTARYRALGNSLALPFWEWLLRRISAQFHGVPRLGSLFDGIGGFPLCWERVNGPGSAVWASEVEEFAIAVTSRRFPESQKEIDI